MHVGEFEIIDPQELGLMLYTLPLISMDDADFNPEPPSNPNIDSNEFDLN